MDTKPRSASDSNQEDHQIPDTAHATQSDHSEQEIIELEESDKSWESENDNDSEDYHEEEQKQPMKQPEIKYGVESLSVFSAHTDAVCCLEIDPTNQANILTGSCDDKAMLWNSNTLSLLKTFDQNKESIAHARYNFDGKYFCTVCLNNEICIYKSETYQLIKKLDGPTAEISFAQWHPLANLIVCGSFDGTIWMFNAINGEVIGTYVGHKGAISTGGFTTDGKLIYSGGADGTVRTWYPMGKNSIVMQKGLLQMQGDEINTAICHPVISKGLIIAGSNEGSVLYCSISSHKVSSIINVSKSSIESIGSSPSGIDVVGDLEGCVTFIDSIMMKIRSYIKLNSGCIKIIMSKNDELCYISTTKGAVYKIDFKKGEVKSIYIGHTGAILDFQVNKEENRLYTAGDDGKCRIYDLSQNKL